MNLRQFITLLIITISLSSISDGATETFDGYTFVYSGQNAYLYDMDKKLIHTWTASKPIQFCADLLKDSSVIVALDASVNFKYNAGAGTYSRLQIINWNNEVTWDFTCGNSEYIPHHDIEPVYRTNDPNEKPSFLIPCYTQWGDKIVELKPNGKNTAEAVWEWFASDHLCKSNCIDITDLLNEYGGGKGSFNMKADAMHTNNLSYNRRLDQIVISCKGYNELLVIDHSTTTEEAKTPSGGKSGKGGSILYRWGYPSNYISDTSNNIFSGQHHCCWVPDTMPGTNLTVPGGGNFMAVNNGRKCAVEISNPSVDGNYTRSSGKPFDPVSLSWSYTDTDIQVNEGSIQKLPNNNYLICSGGTSLIGQSSSSEDSYICKVLEIAPDSISGGRIVWELDGFGTSGEAYRYAYSYLNGSGAPIKSGFKSRASHTFKFTSYCKGDHVFISTKSINDVNNISVFTAAGRTIIRNALPSLGCKWDLGSIPAGIYFVKISSVNNVTLQKIHVEK